MLLVFPWFANAVVAAMPFCPVGAWVLAETVSQVQVVAKNQGRCQGRFLQVPVGHSKVEQHVTVVVVHLCVAGTKVCGERPICGRLDSEVVEEQAGVGQHRIGTEPVRTQERPDKPACQGQGAHLAQKVQFRDCGRPLDDLADLGGRPPGFLNPQTDGLRANERLGVRDALHLGVALAVSRKKTTAWLHHTFLVRVVHACRVGSAMNGVGRSHRSDTPICRFAQW